MKTTVGRIRKLVKEDIATAAPTGGGQNLGQILDSLATTFAAKMKVQFPSADQAIQQEANELKTQLTAIIRSAAAKVKMAAWKPS